MSRQRGILCQHAEVSKYCLRRREAENSSVACMVDDEFVVSGPDDDDVLMYLDSGCNSTCHGQHWMERFEEVTNYINHSGFPVIERI